MKAENLIKDLKHPLIIFYRENKDSWLSSWERNPERTYTDVFSCDDVRYMFTSIAFISETPNEINYISSFRKGNIVATKKVRIAFDTVVKLNNPLTVDFVAHNASKAMTDRVKSAFDSKEAIYYLDNYQLKTIISSLINIDEDYANQIKRIIFPKKRMIDNNRNSIISTERDAIGLVLRINNLDKEINNVVKWDIEKASTPDFMRNLNSITVREDLLIIKDSCCFGDWRMINNNAHGIWTLSNGKNRVTIIYANRTQIESNIGVDLIYFDQNNHSYVFVQYKRLADKNGNFIYYPNSDKNLGKELQLMERLELNLTKDKSDYRFNDQVFYFKFCKEKQDVHTKELSSGFYMPKDYFLLVSELQKNKNSSIAISYDFIQRYLTNTVFIELIQAGLIGTKITDANLISDIIEESLSGKKSLILASATR